MLKADITDVNDIAYVGPKWFVELINRIQQVIMKLLFKFGLKFGM